MISLEIGLCDGVEEPVSDVAESSLENGYIPGGSASAPTGEAWWDESEGPSYGDGQRYEHEETPNITKIKGRQR